uniref:Uncharacterized protein n=1 Tax=viral metagenome TaxID=1070528 RepID=A0A6C0LU18_9ZZZZ
MTISNKINMMTKPTSNIRVSDLNLGIEKYEKNGNDNEINLLTFSRLYKIGGIPIFDLILIFFILYIINNYAQCSDSNFILIATIPTTIIIDLIICRNLKISPIMILIMLLCIFYLYTTGFQKLKYC